MLYADYLKQLHVCPFCDSKDRAICENPKAYLTYAKAPYHRHHLLVVPRRHMKSFTELTQEEKHAIDNLIEAGTKVLRQLGYRDYTVLVREGESVGKTVEHLHYHIIPHSHIGDLDHDGQPRRILTEKEITSVYDELKNAAKLISFNRMR
ncbi:MAG TPA: HIT family protein [Patescibacteria group bacterium]|nr:HIT family protein [Patescibacteria group bacterium]